MKLTIADKTLRRTLIVVAIVAVLLIFIFFRNRSGFVWTAASTDADDVNLKNVLNGYQDTYNIEMIRINGMVEGTPKNDAIMLAEKTLTTNINTAVGGYINTKCPEVVSGTAPADSGKKQKWDNYQTDLASIGGAYYRLIQSATGTVAEDTLAARKADVSGATRRYIANVCPNFYKTATSDPTNSYITWATYDTTAAAGANIGFAKDKVTAVNVTEWAARAATTYTTNSSVSVIAGATTAGPIDLSDVTGLAIGSSIQITTQSVARATGVVTTNAPEMATILTLDTVNKRVSLTVGAVRVGGIIIPSGTIFAKAFKSNSTSWPNNWKLARDAGPGTLPVPIYT